MISRKLMGAAVLLAFASVQAAQAAGGDVVIVASESRPGAQLRSKGTIVDYTGRELVFELPGGMRRKYPADRVLGFETERSPEQLAADSLFQRRQWTPALESYQQAARAESRPWMRRQILAQMVGCFRELNRLAEAGETFLTIVREDPTIGLEKMPLAWIAREPAADVERRAAEWLASADPAARLLGASWLLLGVKQPEALRQLDLLAASENPAIAALAEAQTWRVRFAAADKSQLARWSQKLQQFPDALAAGPYFVLGEALTSHGQTESGLLALARVPILFPHQRRLAAEALWLSAAALLADGKRSEAAGLYSELVSRYADAPRAAEARSRLASLVEPDARFAPAALGAQSAASAASDDQFLAGLRGRRLYGLAENFCRQQLKQSGISDQRLTELSIELSQTYADHAAASQAAWATGEESTQLWRQAAETVQGLIRQEPSNPRLVLLQVQLAVVQARRVREMLGEAEMGASVAWEPARETVREAIGHLRSAESEIADKVRHKRRGETASASGLSTNELRSLERHVRFELARALVVQGRCYPAGSPDRLSALAQADEKLAPLAGRDEADQLVWLSRLARIALARYSGDAAAAQSREQELEAAHPPVDILAGARAQLLRLELDAGHVDAALKLVETYSASTSAAAEWSEAVLRAYLARWQRAIRGGQSDESKAWQTKVEQQVDKIRHEFGPPASQRAELLVACAIAAPGMSTNAALLIKAAETFYRANWAAEAIAAYDQAREQAEQAEPSQQAFDAGFAAAAIEHEQKHYAESGRRFRALALEFPDNSRAADAHLLAAYDMAQWADAAAADFRVILEEQIVRWPQAASTKRALRWLEKLDESEGRSPARKAQRIN